MQQTHNSKHVQKILRHQKTLNLQGRQQKKAKKKQLENDLFVANNSQSNQSKQVDIQVVNSQQMSNLYHFKVMQLRVHEDTGN